MSRRKDVGVRTCRAAALATSIVLLASGCWAQKFHISDESPGGRSAGPCAVIRPRSDGQATALALGVTVPSNLVVVVGILLGAPGSASTGVPVWSGGQPVKADLGPVVGGATYSVWVGAYEYPVGPVDYDTDVNVVVAVHDAQGAEIPVDCVSP